MALRVSVGQRNTWEDRNRDSRGDNNCKQQAGRTRRQCREQHRRQADENSHSPNVRCRAHSAFHHTPKRTAPKPHAPFERNHSSNATIRINCHSEVAAATEESLRIFSLVFRAGAPCTVLARGVFDFRHASLQRPTRRRRMTTGSTSQRCVIPSGVAGRLCPVPLLAGRRLRKEESALPVCYRVNVLTNSNGPRNVPHVAILV